MESHGNDAGVTTHHIIKGNYFGSRKDSRWLGNNHKTVTTNGRNMQRKKKKARDEMFAEWDEEV